MALIFLLFWFGQLAAAGMCNLWQQDKVFEQIVHYFQAFAQYMLTMLTSKQRGRGKEGKVIKARATSTPNWESLDCLERHGFEERLFWVLTWLQTCSPRLHALFYNINRFVCTCWGLLCFTALYNREKLKILLKKGLQEHIQKGLHVVSFLQTCTCMLTSIWTLCTTRRGYKSSSKGRPTFSGRLPPGALDFVVTQAERLSTENLTCTRQCSPLHINFKQTVAGLAFSGLNWCFFGTFLHSAYY